MELSNWLAVSFNLFLEFQLKKTLLEWMI
ncbi:unnamed protein product, partial [Vitis vinifera]